jgi:hypothetical protein
MQGQSLSASSLPEKTSYPLIDSVQAAAANATENDAYVTFPKWSLLPVMLINNSLITG